MDHFKIDQKLLESITANLKREGCGLSPEETTGVVDMITGEVIYPQSILRRYSRVTINWGFLPLAFTARMCRIPLTHPSLPTFRRS